MRMEQRSYSVILLLFSLNLFLAACGNNTQAIGSSTPNDTLTTYCNALKIQDFATAYDQFSGSVKQQISKDFFTQAASRDISSCAVNNVQQNNSSATGQITYTLNTGHTFTDSYSLVNENGQWKISRESSSP